MRLLGTPGVVVLPTTSHVDRGHWILRKGHQQIDLYEHPGQKTRHDAFAALGLSDYYGSK